MDNENLRPEENTFEPAPPAEETPTPTEAPVTQEPSVPVQPAPESFQPAPTYTPPAQGHYAQPYSTLSNNQNYYTQGYNQQGYSGYAQPGYTAPRPVSPKPIVFHDLTGMATAIVVVQIIYLAFAALSVAFSGWVMSMAMQPNYDFSTVSLSVGNSLASSVTSGGSIVVSVLTMLFAYRANQNLNFLGCPVKTYTAGWAAAWYIIPVAALVMPYFVLKEIWEGSQPGYYTWSPDGSASQQKPSSTLVLAWFISQLVSLAGSMVFLVAMMVQTFSNIFTGDFSQVTNVFSYGGLILIGVSAVTQILYIITVKKIAAAQKDKFDMAQAFYVNRQAGK